MKHRITYLAGALGFALITAAACSDDPQTEDDGTTPTTTSGPVGSGGSSSVGSSASSGPTSAGSGGSTPSACDSPESLTVPGSANGDTTGLTSTLDESCGDIAGTAGEIVYSFTAAATETLSFSLDNAIDFGITVRTACDDIGTEIACEDELFGGDGEEVLDVDVEEGTTYFVIIDGYSVTDEGAFTLTVATSTNEPEATCNDLSDDDQDNRVDCADPSECQTLAECTPGAQEKGDTCAANNECSVVAGADPKCLDETTFGFPGGYCSEHCNIVADDCGTDGVCAAVDYLLYFCLDRCTNDDDCAQDDHGCLTFTGLNADVCFPDTCQSSTAAALGDNNGDTVDGYFNTYECFVCTGGGGAGFGNEVVYSFTPAANGSLDLTLSSDTDQGVYVKSDCQSFDMADELGGADEEGGGIDETLSVNVTMGTTYYIVVDAYQPGEEGPFTLNVDLN
jgi:hypothetical protein